MEKTKVCECRDPFWVGITKINLHNVTVDISGKCKTCGKVHAITLRDEKTSTLKSA